MKTLFILTVLLLNTINAFTIYTENYPPFNYKDKNNKLTGITTDIVKEILKSMQNNDTIKLLPWARAYKSIQSKPNIILFSMTRTKKRENLFKWVGPIANNSWVFYAKANSTITINSLQEAKNSKYKIGTYFDGANELFLKGENFTNLDSVPDDLLNVKKLIKNRINLWAAGETQGLYKAKQLNIDPSELKKIFKIKDTQLYIAFSKTTPEHTIKLWQKKLDIMKTDGTYQKILQKYTK